ncbi:hypothetical protein PV682_19325 [Streptomyces niveiscabiei]|uniref:hypothetical protein n=1 Tax=Streptomyces niveiscabiei TaxID=164115 RepID=UPI0029A98380|nr:hypothetical protein [Streptomyces niveiscabiei]MDX3383598.1 hypothetical protein [Streptomyces niveiscabiei]
MKRNNDSGSFGTASDFNIGWRDPDSLRVLCQVAGEKGILSGVEVLPLATGILKREFLVTVTVEEGLVLASARFTWDEVKPPDDLRGIEAARYVLDRVDGIARRTTTELKAYTWLRVASELEQVRMLLERSE